MACLLQTTAGDVDVTNGRVTIIRDPVQAGAIKLANRFQLFLAEWFRDRRVGVPWYQKIFVKNPNAALIKRIIRFIIVTTPPFVDADITYTPPDGKRKANVSFVAYVDPAVSAGKTVTAASLDAPFIVTVPAGST